MFLSYVRRKGLANTPFTVAKTHLNAVFLIQVFCQVLGGVNRTVLAASTAKGEHEGSEASLQVTLHMGIGQAVDTFEEGENLAIVLQETDDGFIKSSELLVTFVPSRVMGGTTVEHVAATIATLILGDTLLIRKAEDADNEGGFPNPSEGGAFFLTPLVTKPL